MPITTDQIQSDLINSGYNKFKGKTRNRIAVLTDEDIVDTLKKVTENFSAYGARYEPFYTTKKGNSISSKGVVLVEDKIIYAKSLSRQGNKAPGVANEISFINTINQYLDEGYGAYHTINVILIGNNKRINISNVLIATKNQLLRNSRQKADVNLIRLGLPTFKISLKKKDSQFWESADSLYGTKALSIINTMEALEMVKIKKSPGNRIDFGNNINGISIRADDETARNVVFGSDIEGRGVIIQQDFSGNSNTNWDDDNLTLTIYCSAIYETLAEVRSSSADPYMFIRKGSDRTSLGGNRNYAGIRVQAIYKSRANSGNIKMLPENFLLNSQVLLLNRKK